MLGSQGDAGQFRTPRHIIDFIVAILEPKKDETVLDPACGTAGFLISAWKHILKANSAPPSPSGRGVGGEGVAPGDLLTPDERGRLAANFKGYDISPDMVRLSLVNLYLHGFTDPHIYEYDTLTSQERWNEYADVILANPPFMSPKGGIRPHNRFSVPSKRSEVLFVDYMAEHLTSNGRAGIIVPEGIIFQSQTAYRQLRRMLVEESLVAVVSLPAGVFQPYSGVKTSILILDKALARTCDRIAFFKVQNDGFGLGAQRRAIDKNDLPAAAAALQAFRHFRASGNPADFDPTPYPGLLVVKKTRIAANGDYNLSGERYRENGERAHIFPLGNTEVFSVSRSAGTRCQNQRLQAADFVSHRKTTLFRWRALRNPGWIYSALPLVRLRDICTINPRKAQLADLPPDTAVSFVPMADVNEHRIALHPSEEKLLSEVSASHTYFEDNDVLLAKVTPCFENGKAGIARNLRNGIGYGSSEFYVLRSCGQVLPEWVYFCVLHPLFRDEAIAQMTGTGGLQRVPRDYVENFQIPVPPLEVQKEIVAKIEGYQKVIDGARAVLDHYRPHIPIHPDWPMVALGEVAEINPKKSEVTELPGDTVVSFVPMAVLGEHMMTFRPEESKPLSEVGASYTYFRNNDVLLAKVTPCFENGKAGIARNLSNGIGFGSSEFFVIRCSENVLPEWAYFAVANATFHAVAAEKMTGTGGLQRIPRSVLEEHAIPLPPLDTQRAIVAEIEAEQALVAANRELIARMEKKIQATLARVWGDESGSANAGNCAVGGGEGNMPEFSVTSAVSPQLV